VNAHNFWRGFTEEAAARSVDWAQAARVAWLVFAAANVLNGGKFVPWPEPLRRTATNSTPSPMLPPIVEMPRTPIEAAALLGVAVDADADAIRASLRDKMANGLHPDHGGDPKLAQQLIAAKNLLIEHLRVPS
jgi:hypothetical protein